MTPCRIFFPTYNTLPHNGNVLLPVRNELSFYIGARSKIYRLIALQHVVVSYLVYPFSKTIRLGVCSAGFLRGYVSTKSARDG